MPSTEPQPQRSAQGAGPQNGHEADHSEQYRYRQNLPEKKTASEREYGDYSLEHQDGVDSDSRTPDVLLDIPVVKIDGMDVELDDLQARVSLQTEARGLVKLNVKIDAHSSRVNLNIQGVEVQTLLKVRLDNIRAVLDRVLTTVDRNPQIIAELVKGISSALQEVGRGAGEAAENGGEDADQAQQASEAAGNGARAEAGGGGSAETVISEARNGSGQTIRRTIQDTGDILETTLDESGDVLEEDITGSLSSLPLEDEYANGDGQTVRLLKDCAGAIISQTLDSRGNTVAVSLVEQR